MSATHVASSVTELAIVCSACEVIAFPPEARPDPPSMPVPPRRVGLTAAGRT
jgi:hypothetical protein